MIGNLVRSNRWIFSKILSLTERRFSCQVCSAACISYMKNGSFSKQSNATILPSISLINQHDMKRHYSIGDYDKLWQAVSSGRGKGRSAKKKVAPKNVDGEFLKFGSEGATYPGFNAPVFPIAEPREPREGRPVRERRKLPRGWSGRSWPGRYAGAPESLSGEEVKGFESIVIEVKRVSVTKKGGRSRQISALVVVGNRNGSIGWAIAKGSMAMKSIKKARNKAVNYLHYVPICDGHTIYHDLTTKHKSTELKFERKVPGYGRRAQRIVDAVCELAGIEDVRCKLIGRTTPLSVIRCAFQGLKLQESHQELAERLGKHVVEYRPEQGNRPIIVATPSANSIALRVEREKQVHQEDISVAFDPHRGAHRPKSLADIKEDYSEVLFDAEDHK